MNRLNRLTTRALCAARRLHHDQRATSLTEFVIALPVLVLIPFGTISIHHLFQDALEINAEANRVVWSKSLPAQERAGSISQMSPLTSALADVAGGNLSFDGGAGGLINSLAADTPGGLYIDSYLKVQLANTIFDVGVEDVHWKVQDIMEPGAQYASAVSLSDQPGRPSGGGSFEGIVSGLLTVAGARPAITGGIRYGSTKNTKITRDVNHGGLNQTLTAEYKLSFPPKPTNRLMAMLTAKLDLNAHPMSDPRKAYTKAILPFKMVPEIVVGTYPDVPTDEEIELQSQICIEFGIDCPEEGDASEFEDKMDCYQDAARNGTDSSEC